MHILRLYNNCCVILTTYMLDSALEPSFVEKSFITDMDTEIVSRNISHNKSDAKSNKE